jgi:protein SCO1/2
MGYSISWFFLIVFCLSIVVFFIAALLPGRTGLPVLGEPGHVTGHFSLTDQEGRVVTHTDVKGRIRVVEFFFTTCKGICPVMNGNLQKIDQAFADNKDVVILSHTVDPDHDSVTVMAAYGRSMRARAGKWYFLTGSKSDLYTLATRDYLLGAGSKGADTDQPFIHSPYVVLVDKENRIRGFYDATDGKAVERLMKDIKLLSSNHAFVTSH